MSGTFASAAGTIHGRGHRFSTILFGTGVFFYCSVAAIIVWEAFAFAAVAPYSLLPTLEAAVGPVCHHLLERSISIGLRTLPVCSRCTGLWFGWILAGIFWLEQMVRQRRSFVHLRRFRQRELVALFTIALLLAAVETVGALSLGNLPRMAAGVPLGFLPGWLLLTRPKQTTGRRDQL